MKVAKVTLPTYLASALINGDESGLEERDQLALEGALALLEKYPGGHYVDVEDERFASHNDLPGRAGNLGGDVGEFTILYDEDEVGEPFSLPSINDVDDRRFDELASGYLEAALFAATDDDQEPLDRRYAVTDFHEDAHDVADKDIFGFIKRVEADPRWQVLHDHLEEHGLPFEKGAKGFDLEQIGRDIWFTMNGHSVGFWSRPEMYGERTAEIFDEAAERRERYVYEINDEENEIRELGIE